MTKKIMYEAKEKLINTTSLCREQDLQLQNFKEADIMAESVKATLLAEQQHLKSHLAKKIEVNERLEKSMKAIKKRSR